MTYTGRISDLLLGYPGFLPAGRSVDMLAVGEFDSFEPVIAAKDWRYSFMSFATNTNLEANFLT